MHRGEVHVLQHVAMEGCARIGDLAREFDAFIRSEMTKWSKVIRESGMRVDLL